VLPPVSIIWGVSRVGVGIALGLRGVMDGARGVVAAHLNDDKAVVKMGHPVFWGV
jgi:hypothetical protein